MDADLKTIIMGLHDLGGPIHLSRLAIHELKRANGSPPSEASRRATIERLDQALDRIGQIVNDLMCMAQSAPTETDQAKVDLCKVAREVSAAWSTAEHASPTISLHVPATIQGSWSELRVWQILSNLIGNAVKHGQGTPIVVRAWVKGEFVYVSVEDAGPGIPEGASDKIFSCGWHGTSSSGRGLGLWIARSMSRSLGGDVFLASAPGTGAKFLVKLPLPARLEA